ncbi:hypothetical protein GCM10022223_47870 [Kineosporia mesophila]|uniref:Scramblase n=1 Tax=Kineosporia mesophila TaxID=566012 RepID=A0ABP7A5A3_9ACTN|nr:hypothetical protein [Kineosporia mesophila]MCD5351479.1 hypothetical protein [Kineosporia mesophila]
MTDRGEPLRGSPDPATRTIGRRAPGAPQTLSSGDGHLLPTLESTHHLTVSRPDVDAQDMHRHEFEVLPTGGSPVLAKLERRPSRANKLLGPLAPVPYELVDAGGHGEAGLLRSAAFAGPARFDVTDRHTGAGIGAVVHDETLLAPRIRVANATGRRLCLVGGAWSSPRYELLDAADDGRMLAGVERGSSGIIRYDIAFRSVMPGPDRLLVVLAVVLLDQLGRRRKENARTGRTFAR